MSSLLSSVPAILDPYSAELELGDFAIGVEGVNGQQVRCRFLEVINVIGAKDGVDQLLEEVVVLVRALGRSPYRSIGSSAIPLRVRTVPCSSVPGHVATYGGAIGGQGGGFIHNAAVVHDDNTIGQCKNFVEILTH